MRSLWKHAVFAGEYLVEDVAVVDRHHGLHRRCRRRLLIERFITEDDPAGGGFSGGVNVNIDASCADQAIPGNKGVIRCDHVLPRLDRHGDGLEHLTLRGPVLRRDLKLLPDRCGRGIGIEIDQPVADVGDAAVRHQDLIPSCHHLPCRLKQRS